MSSTRATDNGMPVIAGVQSARRLAENAVDALAGDPRPEHRARGTSTGAALMWMSYAGGAVAALLLMRVTSLSILVSAGLVLVVSLRWKTRSAEPASR